MFEWPHVLDFWFGPLDAEGIPDEAHRRRWFNADRSFDREVRRRFLSMMLVASEDGLETWRREPGGRLAEILLLDQVPRNIHRGTPLAFDHDAKARSLCREGLDKAADMALPPIGRAFFYMPLEHSEKLADQEDAVALFDQLVASTPAGRLRDVLSGFRQFAVEHRDIIARFGRFPHRNKTLKRESTEGERQFLAGDSSSFGQ